jgi:hypothetical protein
VIALTICTMFSGLSRSVSRVPGEPPRCVMPPATPCPLLSPARTTVVPVWLAVKWPTLMPGTSVIALFGPGTWAHESVAIPVTTAQMAAHTPLLVMSSLR